jgi:hypothetical protein
VLLADFTLDDLDRLLRGDISADALAKFRPGLT